MTHHTNDSVQASESFSFIVSVIGLPSEVGNYNEGYQK